MRYFVFLLVGLLVMSDFAAFGETSAQKKHPFCVKDLVTMNRISGQTVSPDGKWVVFSLRETDLDADKGRKNLWLIGTNGKDLRQLTSTEKNNWNPLWSKDGQKIFFLSSRSGSTQVWRMPMAGGEAVQVTKEPLGVANLILSADGKKMAFSMEVFPGKCVKNTVKQLEAVKKQKTSGRIYDKLFFRHWDTWNDGRRNHIFVLPIEGGTAVDVMKDMDADSPLKPFGGSEEFSFTPDGNSIVFTAANSGRAEAWSTNFDLFVAPVDGSVPPKCITGKNKAWDTTPVFSPDGKTMAYLAMTRPNFEADRYRIMLRSWPDGPERELAPNWDRSPGSIAWCPKGKSIYVIAGNLGQNSLFVIDIKKGSVKTLVRDGKVKSIDFAGKRIVYGLESMKSPMELFSVDAKGKKVQSITAVNAEKLAAIKIGEYEQFTFKGWNDETVYAYMMKPVDFDPAKKYPVAFLIHGGPQGSFGNKFHYRWNPQTYAGAGYAAVMVDFHGSTGYGQAFTDSISHDWGGKPFEDLQKGLAAALKKYPWMDGERVGALGASYGGYMINWIAGNWPSRFRCLINHDGNLDERMAYYDTEELWFPEWEHGGTPWDNPEGYTKHNPVEFIKNWKTPMLVIHGALDFRVVETQGMSTFTVLQRMGIPSKFLYFPDENHWVLSPNNSILWHDTVIDWLDQWCKK
ncbi:MAG: S9 family peptidase [bacterium]|nr:S9 family peptidase [bacterium]